MSINLSKALTSAYTYHEFINKFEIFLLSINEEKVSLKELEKYYNLDVLYIIKSLYYNKNNIHNLLYKTQKMIFIDQNINNLSFNFYLSLLTRENPHCIDYCYSFDYLKEINKKQKQNENKFNKVIMSKIILELINHFKRLDEYDDNKKEEINKIETENNKILKNNITIFNELDISLNNEVIKVKKIDEIYSEIIKALIKIIKFKDFEYILNIIKQLNLEDIDGITILFDKNYKLLNSEEKNINEYIISKNEDLFNGEKINFYYIILKYVLNNNSLFIYQIKFLLKTRRIFINIINSKSSILSEFNMKIKDSKMKERLEYILEIITDSKYYMNKYNNYHNMNIKNKNQLINKNKLSNKEIFSNNDSNSSKKNILNEDKIKELPNNIINNLNSNKNSSCNQRQDNDSTYNKGQNITEFNPENNLYILAYNDYSSEKAEENNINSLINIKDEKIVIFGKITGKLGENKINKNKINISDFFEKKSQDIINGGINNEKNIYKELNENEKIKKLKEFSLNNIFDIKSGPNKIIAICMKDNIFYFELRDTSKGIGEIKEKNLNKTNFLYLIKLTEKEFLLCNEKELFHYSDLFPPMQELERKKIEFEGVKCGIKINKDYTALKVCKFKKNGIFFYKNEHYKIIEKKIELKNYSFVYSGNGLMVIPRKEIDSKNKILLCACKKYFKKGKNGILLINIKFKEKNISEIDKTFYDTGYFEVYCFCPIIDTAESKISKEDFLSDYFLVGGFDQKKYKGMIKLYKANYGKNNEIEYIQDIIFDNNTKYKFEGFKMPISSIILDKNDENGNILISCWDGNVYLLSLFIEFIKNIIDK